MTNSSSVVKEYVAGLNSDELMCLYGRRHDLNEFTDVVTANKTMEALFSTTKNSLALFDLMDDLIDQVTLRVKAEQAA